MDEASFDRLFNINVRGAYFTIKYGAPMIPDGGAIILLASVAGSTGVASTSVYSASKAALPVARPHACRGTRAAQHPVNTVSPGPIETPLQAKLGMPEEQLLGLKEFLKAKWRSAASGHRRKWQPRSFSWLPTPHS